MTDPSPTNGPPPLPASARRRPKILARWALLPLIPFLLLQIIYGWPAAKLRFEYPGAAIGPFIASLLFGLLISLLFAWIGYRVSGRSQFNGSVVFTAMILVCTVNAVVPVCGCYLFTGSPLQFAQQRGAVNGRPSWKPQTEFPSFGFRVESLPGWPQAEPKETRVLAWWGSPDTTENDLRAFITLQWEAVGSRSLDQRAQAVATSLNGKIDDQPVSLDGQPARRIVALPAETGVKPVEVIITSHDDNFFLIIGAVTRGRSCHDQIDFICKSWRWLPKDSKP